MALRGIDVVSYFQPGGPVKGRATWRHDFDGVRYLFSSEKNKAAFVADPDRWLPQFDGLCTTGLSKG
ncbi:MAG: YHS domain protein, partial [Rubrivivax sp.]|nr:YHS domain protein [Rubrivivax sp.]